MIYPAINSEIKTAFRWYYSDGPSGGPTATLTRALNRQTRNRAHVQRQQQYRLYSRNDSMLPWQFLEPEPFAHMPTNNFGPQFILDWRLIPAAELCIGGAMPAEIDLYTRIYNAGQKPSDYIESKPVPGQGIYHTYKGTALPLAGPIPPGFWYSLISLDDGSIAVSEVFYVVKDNAELDKLCRLEWTNGCDKGGIFYQTGFVNHLYLTGVPTQNQPVIYEEGHENGRKEFIQDFVVFLDNYSIQEPVPEYVYNALLMLRMMDNIYLQLPKAIYRGRMKAAKVEVDWLENSYLGICKMELVQEIQLTASGCCNNSTVASLIPPVTQPDSYIIFPHSGIIYLPVNVLANDTGYSIRPVWQGTAAALSPGGAGTFLLSDGITAHTTNPIGSLGINKTTPASNVNQAFFTYKVYDPYGTQSGLSLVVLNYKYPLANPDYVSTGFILPGQMRGPYASVLLNDVRPLHNNQGNNSFYLIANIGVQLSAEGDGSYINLQADGTFTFVKGSGSFSGTTLHFTYGMRDSVTFAIYYSTISVDISI